MSDREIRTGVRLLLATGEREILSHQEQLQLLTLLADGVEYTIRGLYREIDEWDSINGAAGNPRQDDFKYINGSFSTLQKLDSHLEVHGLPPLRQWEYADEEMFHPPKLGVYTICIREDENGVPDENGEYLCDYILEVRITFYRGLVPPHAQD